MSMSTRSKSVSRALQPCFPNLPYLDVHQLYRAMDLLVDSSEQLQHACMLRSHSAYGRYIRQDEEGTLFLNTEKIASEALLDGKFLISTSPGTRSLE